MLLDGKVVLVTGGGRNVGAGIVRSVAREGAMVVINYNKSAEKAEALCESLTQQGLSALTWQCDVSDEEAVRAMIDGVVEKCGRIDGVVNNASNTNHTPDRERWSFDRYLLATWDDFCTEMDVSVKAVLNTIKASFPYMKEQGGGRIVNIVTMQWNVGSDGGADHVTGKAAMVGLSRWISEKLCRAGNITVNMVAPAATVTERTLQWRAEHPEVEKDDYERWTPFQRRAEAEEIGDACVFFLSDLATYISGAYLLVAGGLYPQMGN